VASATFLIAAAAAVSLVAGPYLRAAALIVRATGTEGWPGRLARWDASSVTEAAAEIPTRYGPAHAVLYRPAGRVSRSALLVSGVHPAGAEESRLRGLARDLAGAGFGVVTPEIADLMNYRITSRATDTIEDAARWLSGRADLAPDHRVGLMGISFSGGLAIVAAGRPALRNHIAYVFSFGGYGSLPRVLKYLCGGAGSAAASGAPPPHDYGVAVVLYGVVDRVVPPAQVSLLREGVLTFLSASSLAGIDRPRSEELFAKARALEAQMPDPAATLMHEVNTRDVSALGPRLLPHIGALGDDPSLSPERSPAPAAPVYLLHALGDNVTPTAETPRLGAYLEQYTRVRVLLTPLVAHAGVSPDARASDLWPLVSFWTDLLSN
jgi:dienelactone hydrolase